MTRINRENEEKEERLRKENKDRLDKAAKENEERLNRLLEEQERHAALLVARHGEEERASRKTQQLEEERGRAGELEEGRGRAGDIPECPVCKISMKSFLVSYPSILQVCMEEMLPPARIFQCTDGHLVCGTCRYRSMQAQESLGTEVFRCRSTRVHRYMILWQFPISGPTDPPTPSKSVQKSEYQC